MVLMAMAKGRFSGGTVHIVAMFTDDVVMKINMHPRQSSMKNAMESVMKAATRQMATPMPTSTVMCHRAFLVLSSGVEGLLVKQRSKISIKKDLQ